MEFKMAAARLTRATTLAFICSILVARTIWRPFAFGSVKIPWMLMTGTKDTSPIGGQTVETRLAVFPALAAGDKYELVLNNAEHSVFTDRALPGDREPRDPNHHRVILALSTAFWDAFVKQNDD